MKTVDCGCVETGLIKCIAFVSLLVYDFRLTFIKEEGGPKNSFKTVSFCKRVVLQFTQC